jgi:arylsulfatase B
MAVAAAVTHATNRADRPHMVALLADDLGYYDTAVHNPRSPTPTLAALAADGLLLERHYVFRFCSPSRRSFLTGRLPTSITTVQPDGGKFCSDFTPLATRLLSEKLAAVGYRCHFVGKGHLGYQTMDHLPIQRGFASHVGYLSGSEGYSHGGGAANPTLGTHDLWRDLAPATSDVPTMVYSADFYSREAVKIIEDHGQRADRDAAPLFMWTPPPTEHRTIVGPA